MPRYTSTAESSESWTEQAIRYTEEHGWQIVPLQANSRSSPSYSEDPVEKQLDSFVHVDYPEEATSDPEKIRTLGTQFPVALIGAVTGRASDLLAMEVQHPQVESSSVRDRIEAIASDAPRILGTNREYVLFRYPDTAEPIPRLSETEGVVLHGEGSVIRLPWRYYKWSFDAGPMQTADDTLLSLFQVGPLEAAPDPETGALALNGEGTEDRRGQSGDSLPISTNSGTPDVRSSDSLFRSGDDLSLSSDEKTRPALPWMTPGGLSLLTAPAKAGKSTWTLNLVAHLVAGQPFLEGEAAPSEVVMLADTSPPSFRRLLQGIDVPRPDDLSRLHVVHSRDVCQFDWRSTLQRAYRRVEEVGADLLVIDCLDRYVRLKGGGVPTGEEEVVHALTAEAPPGCAVLAVKSCDCDAREPIAQTTRRLGLLGGAADTLLRLDDVSNASFPRLRRLLAISFMGGTPDVTYCALRQGRYERIRRDENSSRPKCREETTSPDRFVVAPGFNSLPT